MSEISLCSVSDCKISLDIKITCLWLPVFHLPRRVTWDRFHCIYYKLKYFIGTLSHSLQTGIVVLSDANSRDPYRYLMCVVTGWWAGAETTARISCYISGNGGNSKKHCLSDSVVNKGYFKAGWEDWFLFTSPYHLGNLESVTVWHDNSGTSPSWFVQYCNWTNFLWFIYFHQLYNQ